MCVGPGGAVGGALGLFGAFSMHNGKENSNDMYSFSSHNATL